MKAFKLDYVGERETLSSFGSLFRQQSNSPNNAWKSNTRFYPNNNRVKYLPFHDVPVLARKRIYNDSEQIRARAWTQSFSIENCDGWQVQDASEYPRLKLYGDDGQVKCFVFSIDKGTTVYLPQFELARILFFHNAYLACTALEPAHLNLDFDVSVDMELDRARINIMHGSGYTADLLKSQSDRNFLSWILLDPEAQRLYGSISRHQYLSGVNRNGYRKWNFQFDIPRFKDVSFDIRGDFDRESGSLFVYEIEKIKNLPADIPTEIDIYHPDFILDIKEDQPKKNVGKGEVRQSHGFGDGKEIDTDINGKKEDTDTSAILFAKKFLSIKVNHDVRLTSRRESALESIDDVAEGNAAKQAASESVKPGIDRNNANDITDHLQLYKSKFQYFSSMIDQLQGLNEAMIIGIDPHPLPRLQRFSKFMLNAMDKPRYIEDVTIRWNKIEVHILEIDTSDGDTQISTKLIRVEDRAMWKRHLDKIEYRLIKQSLVWPTKEYFDALFGEDMHMALSHPKHCQVRVSKIPEGNLPHSDHII